MTGVAYIGIMNFFVVRVNIRANDAKDEHLKNELCIFFFFNYLPLASYGIVYCSLLMLQ